jgi:peptidoglycan/xylan/chitin deacetylase (PgdA/CDA1 family)
LKVALKVPLAEVKIIQELLMPWEITFTNLDDSDIAIVYKQKPPDEKKAVVIPSDSEEFSAWSKNTQIETVKTTNNTHVISANIGQLTLSIRPKILYKYKPTSIFESDLDSIGVLTNNDYALGLDIVEEYVSFLNDALAAQQSKLYRLFTGLPIPYGIAPKKVRDHFMKEASGNSNCTLCDKLHVDALRLILVQAINKLTGEEIKRKQWTGQRFACLMTHDIEDREGFERAPKIKKLEEKYDLPSAWFIPSKRYTLDNDIIKSLTNFGEVGAHDTKHDGKLASLSKQMLIERLSDAKHSLNKRSESPVNGFRAPLLQHNFQILEALNASGYKYDASIPTWEPKHPYTMKSHGIGTIFPFHINGFPEVPLSLPQDHQMLHTLGLTAQQTVEKWTDMMLEAKTLGGLCVFLTHPNELANQENQNSYEDLLNNISNEKDCHITLPIEVTENI